MATAEIGDLIEFMNPWLGFSLWGVYAGENHVIHFGVEDENMTQKACRSFLQYMVPKSKRNCVLKKTKIRRQHTEELKVPPETRIRVNNSKHNLVPSSQEMMKHRCNTFLHQEFEFDLLNFNSEHFATFVRYGQAVCNQTQAHCPSARPLIKPNTLYHLLITSKQKQESWTEILSFFPLGNPSRGMLINYPPSPHTTTTITITSLHIYIFC
ncbi:hypothetical protein Q8A73_007991 [Channa argus]|nr:hypothetical protein Q8A73_007991 [Channa argus]